MNEEGLLLMSPVRRKLNLPYQGNAALYECVLWTA